MAGVERYDPASIEPRWVAEWDRAEPYTADENDTTRPKFYALDMFPYPSGDLHMGHLEAFSGGDVVARYRWQRGYNVLHPIGWDAFGLPAENAAIKRGINPKTWTYANIDQQANSFKRLGMSFDWSRRFNSCDPDYYVWTQWLFLKFLEKDLVYRKASPTNWCPKDKTVLANEQVVGGLCERCDTPVVKRDLVQWFFRESNYAQRLLDDMSVLTGWTDHLLTIQRNWIGRSEGADVTFEIAETKEKLTVFTTRPDTLWGVTFMALAPEHPLAKRLVAGVRAKEFDEYLTRVRRLTEIERTTVGRTRDGLFTGAHAINPVNGDRVPIWVADYVLMDYGTGALMGVPGHDERDFEFARQQALPVHHVIAPISGSPDETRPYEDEGTMFRSGPMDGTPSPSGIPKVIAYLEENGLGSGVVRYRLRDWNVSRQRAWGCPIPIIHCPTCKEVPVPYEDLPVLLPELTDWTPSGTGSSPLAKVEDWVNVTCPNCGGGAKRETDTFDTFIDSSWYFFRYTSPGYDKGPFDPAKVERWMPADQYIGGDTHATGHLIYSRFFTKVLYDLDMIGFPEPYPNLVNQGTVIMEGSKMSKSRGNLVTPTAIVDKYGADTARVTMLFAGPYETDVDWADVSPQGVYRWLSRVWRLALENLSSAKAGEPSGAAELRRRTHRAIAGVTNDVERFRFNTAISKLMVLANDLSELGTTSEPADVRECVLTLIALLQPFAPFIAAELWERYGQKGPSHLIPWPSSDPALAAAETVMMVVQVNGRVRDRIEVTPGLDEAAMEALARASEKVREHIEGKQIRKTITVPPKLVNFVV